MVQINKALLPIKAHYFFFMAAMGPILPQINVFGKQLGISADVAGLIMSVLPLMYILAKPAVGFLIDYFTNLRKVIFMTILLIITLCYASFYFIPLLPDHKVPVQDIYNFSMGSVEGCRQLDKITSHESLCREYRPVRCDIQCSYSGDVDKGYDGFLTTYKRRFGGSIQEEQNDTDAEVLSININFDLCLQDERASLIGNNTCDLSCSRDKSKQPDCVVGTATFWSYVLLMCLGTIGFNVANCVSDATCFDMLGELKNVTEKTPLTQTSDNTHSFGIGDTQTMKYGAQRVWGTIGFGVSALIAGVAGALYGDVGIAPPLIVMLVFSSVDVFCIKWLRLPALSSANSIWDEVMQLLRQRTIVIFLAFATLAGIIDSFIIYYMFWHLEDVAKISGHTPSVKLIEGCVVAAECLGSEILFFLISGKILKRIGYVHCLSFCFAMYAVRLGLISLITNPWYLVLIEFFMQGPTYALCYTCIVAYASAVSPPGTTGTVQGLVAGMDDGVGFAIGALIGGQTFKRLGGRLSFQAFSLGAAIVCVSHIFLRPSIKHETMVKKIKDGAEYEVPLEQMKVEPHENGDQR